VGGRKLILRSWSVVPTEDDFFFLFPFLSLLNTQMHILERHEIPLQLVIRSSLASHSEHGKGTSLKLLAIQAAPFYLAIHLGVLVTLGWSWVAASQASFFFFVFSGGLASLTGLFAVWSPRDGCAAFYYSDNVDKLHGRSS
jgi:hypothetical protein